MAAQLSQQYHRQTVTATALKYMGLALWQTLAIKTPPARLLIDDHQTINLPWECLYHPEIGFLGKQPGYTLSRYPPSGVNCQSTCAIGPLRILLFTTQAAHTGSTTLAVELEQQAVRTALAPWIAAGWVDLLAPDDGRFATLKALLNAQNWHVVILSGHSIFQAATQQTYFVFEDQIGQPDKIAADVLATLLGRYAIACVVLTACQSQPLARAVAQAGIPHVIGMREPLMDKAAIVFIEAFCKAIAQQAYIDVAVQQARQAMIQLLTPKEVWHTALQQYNDPNAHQWCLPILLSRDPCLPLANWHFSPQIRPKSSISNILQPSTPFIGRRQVLRILSDRVRRQAIQRLWIKGTKGVGKTMLVKQLLIGLTEYGYQIHDYQNKYQIDTVNLKSTKCIVWLENEQISKVVAYWRAKQPSAIIIVTARHTAPPKLGFYEYLLTQPVYNDFFRYAQYLGLPHSTVQIRLMYRYFQGQFKGLQLLSTLPVCIEKMSFYKQLMLVQRFLRAY